MTTAASVSRSSLFWNERQWRLTEGFCWCHSRRERELAVGRRRVSMKWRSGSSTSTSCLPVHVKRLRADGNIEDHLAVLAPLPPPPYPKLRCFGFWCFLASHSSDFVFCFRFRVLHSHHSFAAPATAGGRVDGPQAGVHAHLPQHLPHHGLRRLRKLQGKGVLLFLPDCCRSVGGLRMCRLRRGHLVIGTPRGWGAQPSSPAAAVRHHHANIPLLPSCVTTPCFHVPPFLQQPGWIST